MAAGVKDRDDAFWELTLTVGKQALRIAELEALLAKLTASCTTPEANADGADRTTPRILTDTAGPYFDAFAEAYNKLHTEHEKLKQEHEGLKQGLARCENKIARLQTKYTEAREGVKVWHKYLARKQREGWPPTRGVDRATSPGQNIQESTSSHSSADRIIQNVNPALPSSTSYSENSRDGTDENMVSSRNITSSQTTVVEQEPEAPPKPPVDSDADDVEFVSARSSKRRKMAHQQAEAPYARIKKESQSPPTVIHIKSDSPENPPAHARTLVRTETSDLDVIGGLLSTPRRPRSSQRREDRKHDASNTRPLIPKQKPLSTPSSKITDRKRKSPQSHRIIDALRPISANVPMKSRSNIDAKLKSSFRRIDDDKIAVLSEDGSDAAPDKNRPTESTDTRLISMLDGPSPSKTAHPPLLPRPTRPSRSPLPSTTKRPEPSSNEPASSAQPLRSLPLSDLRLDHFVINPAYLNTTFAISHTIRGKEARKNLHVCTRPDCCGGALLKAIEMGGSSLSGKSDAQALKQYLGDDWEAIVKTHDATQRGDLAMQAHAFSFAQQHGKHRQAFERPRTPPGFWKTHFPTTQEALEDREEANELERGKVEERWHEALRAGGRWKFRDE